jgi:cation:H+ antiporter
MPRTVPPQLTLATAVGLLGGYLGAADYLGLPHPGLSAPLAALVFGVAIIGAAFVLSWAAEAAQVDISAGLALALLALLAVLPEYAVDFVFTFQAGQIYEQQGLCVPRPDGSNPCSLALANMTGANRVLVGVGWPLVVLVASLAALRARRQGGQDRPSSHPGRVALAPSRSAEVVFLGIATLYSLTLPLRRTLTMIDAGVLVTIFVAYAWRLSQAPAQQPDLAGVAQWVGGKPRAPRRRWVGAMFAVAAVVILCSAEHFAQGLVGTGDQLGVNQFVLVQWVAPLASESPELLVACLYAWRFKASDSLGALLSSKVNQWTLLVGTIPGVFALSATTTDGLPLDTQQRFELLLTAAQSVFAVSILANLCLTVTGAVTLLVLFAVQFITSFVLSTEANQLVIIVLSAVYGALAAGQLLRRRRETARLLRAGLVTPFPELADTPR